MAPVPVNSEKNSHSPDSDEYIVYPLMALTIVIFTLFLGVFCVIFSLRQEIPRFKHVAYVWDT